MSEASILSAMVVIGIVGSIGFAMIGRLHARGPVAHRNTRLAASLVWLIAWLIIPVGVLAGNLRYRGAEQCRLRSLVDCFEQKPALKAEPQP